MKLNELLDLFLRVDRAPQTRSTYKRFLTRFVDAIGPERPANSFALKTWMRISWRCGRTN